MRQAAGLLLLMLLGACAHQAERPAAPTSAQAPAGTGLAPVKDNIHLPQSERYARQHDSAPPDLRRALQRAAALPDPVPKVEPRSRYGNAAVYSVRGRTYHVLPSAAGYHAIGTASWYGRKFHGHLTSSMERYDMYQFTAAHKTLPLPTWVRVTNLDNHKSVLVRVNDRGPFHDDRLIDLSWAAAARIGILAQGTGRVEVTAIDPAHPAEPLAPVVVPNKGAHLYLQVGAYAKRGNAQAMLRRLRGLGIDRAELASGADDGLLRVRIGPFADAAAAHAAARRLQQHGIVAMATPNSPSTED